MEQNIVFVQVKTLWLALSAKLVLDFRLRAAQGLYSLTIRRVATISRGVSKPRDWMFTVSLHRFETQQVPWQRFSSTAPEVLVKLQSDRTAATPYLAGLKFREILRLNVWIKAHSSYHDDMLIILYFTEQIHKHSLTCHFNDVIMTAMASQITSLTIVSSNVYSGADQGSIKAPRQWPLCGEFTGDRWIPRTNGQLLGKCFHLMTSSCIYHNIKYCR